MFYGTHFKGTLMQIWKSPVVGGVKLQTHVSTNTYVVSENIPFTTKTFLILLMSALFFFCENLAFLPKIVPLLKAILWKLCFSKLLCFLLCFAYLSFTDHASGIWLPDCSRLARNWKNDNDAAKMCWHDIIVNSFWRCRVSVVNFSY